jgi:hypothetical protein
MSTYLEDLLFFKFKKFASVPELEINKVFDCFSKLWQLIRVAKYTLSKMCRNRYVLLLLDLRNIPLPDLFFFYFLR